MNLKGTNKGRHSAPFICTFNTTRKVLWRALISPGSSHASAERPLVEIANRFLRASTQKHGRWSGDNGKKDRTPFGVHTEGALASTNFAREFPRKRGTSFGRNCEPVFACKHAKARSMEW